MNPSMIFTLDNLQHGWSHVHIAYKEANFDNDISFTPNDGLADFLCALLAVIPYPGAKARCAWSNEPGYFQVTLMHWPPQQIDMRIQFVPTYRIVLSKEHELRTQLTCDLQKFVKKVCTAYRKLLSHYGEDGYKGHWYHPFPLAEYQQICAYLVGGKNTPHL